MSPTGAETLAVWPAAAYYCAWLGASCAAFYACGRITRPHAGPDRRNNRGRLSRSDGWRIAGGNGDMMRGCYCPDDCACHHAWRVNVCGCRAHELEPAPEVGRAGLIWLVMDVTRGPRAGAGYPYRVDVIILDGLPGERSRYRGRGLWDVASLTDDRAYVLSPRVDALELEGVSS